MKILLAQQNFLVGAMEDNAAKMCRILRQYGNECDLVLFPELAVAGAFPLDLLTWPGFRRDQEKALQQLRAASREVRAAVAFGLVAANGRRDAPFFNTLAFYEQGEEVGRYHQRFVPADDLNDEGRYIAPGNQAPFWRWQGRRIGVLLGEELETAAERGSPTGAAELEATGPELLLAVAASPGGPGRPARRLERAAELARRCGAPLVFLNRVGGDDGVVYDGGSFLLDHKGRLCESLGAFREEQRVVDTTAAGDSEPSLPDTAGDDSGYLLDLLRTGLADYAGKCGFERVVVGASGGIDSSLTLALAARALGPKQVTALIMPSSVTSQESRDCAHAVCRSLGVQAIEVSIEEEYRLSRQRFHNAFGEEPAQLTCENMQARIRGRILMEYSNQTGALVVSTGNRSEMSVGYVTLYGDMDGGIALLGDLFKTQVYALATEYNRREPRRAIPEQILKRTPSAELAEGQTDQDVLPDYAQLDALLKLTSEARYLEPDERRQLQQQVRQLGLNECRRLLQMVARAEFKRRQAPPVIRVQPSSLARRTRLPLAGRFPELKNLEELFG